MSVGTAVLVVDDDPRVVELVRVYLEREGFEVTSAHDGQTALSLARSVKPDLVVLDVMLPRIDGINVCRLLRRETDAAVIMLTARDEEADKLVGLDVGADDYVTKPFSPRELVARVKAVLRRTRAEEPVEDVVRLGGLAIDFGRHEVRVDGAPVELTPTEFKLLEILSRRPGRVFTRLQLMDFAQGAAFEGYERTIDVHIKNLRKKIETDPARPRYIATVYGVGYKFRGDSNEGG